MGQRLDHYRENKKYTEELWDQRWLDGIRGFAWRSWIRHPFANTRFRYWNTVPHLPRLEISVTSIGSVNHEYRDADCIYLSDVCKRCSFSIDEGTFVPWHPDEAA